MLKEQADSSILVGNWNPDLGKKLNKDLFVVGDRIFTIRDFVEYSKTLKKLSNHSPAFYFDLLFKQYQDTQIKKYEEDHLEDKYLDYKMLVKEYREGIMLFQLMEEEVWNKAIEDSLGLQDFYDQNKNDYMWGERAKIKLYSSKNEEIITRIKKAVDERDTIFLSKENLYKTFNSGSSVTLQTESGTFEKGVIEVLDQVEWEEGVFITNYAGKQHLVWIQEVQPPRVKKLNEANTELEEFINTVEICCTVLSPVRRTCR